MRERARATIDEILGSEPTRVLPEDTLKTINDIAKKAIAAQKGN
jgi:hypothetical protein